ncbi:hypothetical protein BH11PLA1_BH11PLA1_12280 [soil metagenome]
MHHRSIIALTILLAGGAALLTHARAGPANGIVPPPAAPAPRPLTFDGRLREAAALAGVWRTEVDGAIVEETWSEPRGSGMVGMFRWLRADGTPTVIELLALNADSDGLHMRLRHFTSTLTAREEKDAPVTLRQEPAAGVMKFIPERNAGEVASITYTLRGDELAVEVDFRPAANAAPGGAGVRAPIALHFHRYTPGTNLGTPDWHGGSSDSRLQFPR